MLRLALCLSFVLACRLGATEEPTTSPPTKSPPLLQGSARIEGDNLRYRVSLMRHAVKEAGQMVVIDGWPVKQKRAIPIPYVIAQERVLPLKNVRGQVVCVKGDDPTKPVRWVDGMTLKQLIKADTRILFVVNGTKLEPVHLKDYPEGTIILLLPRDPLIQGE